MPPACSPAVNTRNRRRSTFQRRCKQWRNFSAKCSPEQRLKYIGSKCHGATHGINAGERINVTGKEGATMDKCKNPRKVFANADIYSIYDERANKWQHTTADRILSGLMGTYQSI